MELGKTLIGGKFMSVKLPAPVRFSDPTMPQFCQSMLQDGPSKTFWNSDGGVFLLGPVFGGDDDPQAINLKAMFETLVAQGGSIFGLKLTGSLEAAKLGDAIAFLLGDAGLLVNGKAFGLGTLLYQQFGVWFANNFRKLLREANVVDILGLKGNFRRRRLDPTASAKKPDSGSQQHKLYCAAYFRCLERRFGQILGPGARSLTLLFDGSKVEREAVELIFAYSSNGNIGGLLPYQARRCRCRRFDLSC